MMKTTSSKLKSHWNLTKLGWKSEKFDRMVWGKYEYVRSRKISYCMFSGVCVCISEIKIHWCSIFVYQEN